MSTFDELRSQLGRAWESVAEGWQHLRSRASDALTRFTPTHGHGELETVEDAVVRNAARWGLLAAELRETEDAFVVRLEVPGMDPDGFEIAVVDHTLTVRGEKRVEREGHQGRYHLMECAYGRFERLVPLPAEVDEARASARYRKGILQVTLPKRGWHGTRRISVESAS
jgi:HSP20 family protein